MRDLKYASNQELIRMSRKRPSTLYEMEVLRELAIRAVRGEAPLEPAIEATVSACRYDPPIFGGPPGRLAAAVFNAAPSDIASAFWTAARESLDGLSLEVLESCSPPSV